MSLLGVGAGIIGGSSVIFGAGAGMISRRIIPGAGLGIGLGTAALVTNRATQMMTQGTSVTNPVFYPTASKSYGKRGIDGNNMNTGNLVQNLHKNRRKF